MTYLTFPITIKIMAGLGLLFIFNSCTPAGYEHQVSSPSISYTKSSVGSLNRESVSSETRIVIKTASVNLEVNNVRQTGESIEEITTDNGAHMLNYHERDDKIKNSSFSIRVPSQNLVTMIDQIAKLGKVTYRKINVKDKTTAAIAHEAILSKLKERRKRLSIMLQKATKISDQLVIEETLAQVEEEIFTMEEGAKQARKFSTFSQLSISLEQRKIRGPVGSTLDGIKWSWSKLFTLRK